MTNIELERRFPSIGRQRLALRCPYCGRIHRKLYRRMLAATLLLVSALIAWSAPIARAGSSPDVDTSAQKQRPTDRRVQQVVVVPSAMPMAMLSPTPSPVPSPTPLPIPTTGIVWSPASAGAYLYE